LTPRADISDLSDGRSEFGGGSRFNTLDAPPRDTTFYRIDQ
jgi:hypothetical protein